MGLYIRRLLLLLLVNVSFVCSFGQIRNRLGVGNELYLRYASGRIRQFDESNIPLADSIYRFGVYKSDSRIRMLALSLELPPRFIRNDTARVDEIISELKSIIEKHVEYTGSKKGQRILDNFDEAITHFKKIIPSDYKEMLRLTNMYIEQGCDSEEAKMELGFL